MSNSKEWWYERTKDGAHAGLFLASSGRWAAFVITPRMIRNNQPMVYIVDETNEEDTEQLKTKIKQQFPTFLGFRELRELWWEMKSVGADKLDLDAYPKETHFLKRSLADVWPEEDK